MVSRSPERNDRKMNQSVDLLKRDKPIFTSRQFGPSQQQPPEFFTDSINASYIPSPSSTREKTRPSIRAKPRQALGTPGSLAASFKAVGEVKHENQRSSTSSSDLTLESSVSNSRYRQSNARRLARSPTKPTTQILRRRTPSPARGRQISLVSPSSSASSPPRGLAEAYQRINDEESLAQEDCIDDDMGTYPYDFESRERSREVDRIRMQRIQDAVSPISLKASRRASPRGLVQEQPGVEDQAKGKEDNLLGSDSESAISNVDNLTESSVVALSQHAQDLQRITVAMRSENQVFSKALISHRVGLTVENLKRRNESNESLSSAYGAGSSSSKTSDPSLNVPQKWGRKARPGRDWLNRINNKNGKLTGDAPKKPPVETVVTKKPDREELLEDWVNTEENVLNPIEEVKSMPLAQSNQDFVVSGPNTSADQVSEWEINDDDFTGRSLQVSDSPPIRVRSATLDRILEREIDTLAKRAVTTSRLGELREKTLEENLRPRLQTQSTDDLSQEHGNDETPRRRRSSLKFPLKPFVKERSYSKISEAVLGSGGDPIPDSPITIYRGTSDVSSIENEQSGPRTDDESGSAARPINDRTDSRDLLRKLARVTSQSPTPTKEGQQPDVKRDVVSANSSPSTNTPSKVRTVAAENPQQAAKAENGTENIHLPEKASIKKPVQQTPRHSKSTADLKTPLVTGAWIDTPLPTGNRGPPLPTPADLEDDKDFTVDNGDQTRKIATTDLIRKLNPNVLSTRPKLSSQRLLKETGPLLPKSALESIIAAAKSNSEIKSQRNFTATNSNSDSEDDPTLHLGDSTIQSLEEILDDHDCSTLLTQPAQSPSITSPDEDLTDPEPFTEIQESRQPDLQSYARQISRLGNVGPSIRDAKRRLAKLEKAISNTVSNPPSSKSPTVNQGECDEAGEFHDFIWPCERCGCPARRDLAFANSVASDMTSVQVPLPKLWRWRKDDWRPRLTWLGVVTLVAWGWWVGEWIAW